MPIDHLDADSADIDPFADSMARRTANVLIQQTEARIKQLFALQKNINERQSSVDILMKRYFIEKSFLDKVADGYGQRTGWGKVVYGSVFIGVITLVGAIFSLAAFFAVAAIVIFSTAAVILQNHHDIATSRNERFCKDIVERETASQREVAQLSEIEDKLNGVLVNLGLAQLRLLEDNTKFELTIEALKEQVASVKVTLHELEEIKNTLFESNQHLAQQFESAHLALLSAQEELHEKSLQMDALNEEFKTMQAKLSDGSSDLEEIHLAYQRRLVELAALETGFDTQLSLLTTSIEQNRSTRSVKQIVEKDTNPEQSNSGTTGPGKNRKELEKFAQFLANGEEDATHAALEKANALLEQRRSKKEASPRLVAH